MAGEGALAGRFGAFFLTYMPVEGSANVTVFMKDHWNLPDSSYRQVFEEEVGFVSIRVFYASGERVVKLSEGGNEKGIGLKG